LNIITARRRVERIEAGTKTCLRERNESEEVRGRRTGLIES
jgi:hypothetical protein